MIEKSLLYIYTSGGTPRFVGCGVLVEGPHVATCRHVWRLATQAEGATTDAVEIEFPHAYHLGERVRTRATLTDACDPTDGPVADLVLLAAEEIPSGVMALQLASDARYEVGKAVAVAGLVGRGKTGMVEDVNIEGRLADTIRADGRRQFTGNNAAGFWLERGSSGSPVFLERGQQLAGILSLSELGANAGQSHLHEAFVVRGQTIREHVRRAATLVVARAEHVPLAAIREILAAEGMQNVPTAEIPTRLKQYFESARAYAAEPAEPSHQGNDVDAIIGAARKLVGELRPDEALGLLRIRIDEEDRAYAQRRMPLLLEMLQVQRIALDHDGAQATLFEIARIVKDNAWVWFEIGDSWQAAGHLSKAMEAYVTAQDAAVRTGDTRDILVSHGKIGDVVRTQGDGQAALDAYHMSLAIAETLAKREPANTQWQRDLSVGHNKIGDVLRAQGKGQAALDAYRLSLAIRETLAERDPANTEWQRDLSVSHDRIGDVLMSQGDRQAALNAYRKSLSIAEILAKRDPTNTQWQRDLSVSHNKIGDVLRAQGENQSALDVYRQSLTIIENLATHDPTNTGWQRDLSVSHERIGDVLKAQGDEHAALDAYRLSLTTAETLAGRDPDNTEWQRDLSVSYEKIGDVLMTQGEEEAAVNSYRKSLAIVETLVRRDPANTHWQRDLIISNVKISIVLPSEAQDFLKRGLAIARSLKEAERLAPIDLWMITDLEDRLSKL